MNTYLISWYDGDEQRVSHFFGNTVEEALRGCVVEIDDCDAVFELRNVHILPSAICAFVDDPSGNLMEVAL